MASDIHFTGEVADKKAQQELFRFLDAYANDHPDIESIPVETPTIYRIPEVMIEEPDANYFPIGISDVGQLTHQDEIAARAEQLGLNPKDHETLCKLLNSITFKQVGRFIRFGKPSTAFGTNMPFLFYKDGTKLAVMMQKEQLLVGQQENTTYNYINFLSQMRVIAYAHEPKCQKNFREALTLLRKARPYFAKLDVVLPTHGPLTDELYSDIKMADKWP